MLAQKQNNNFLSLSAMRKVAQIVETPEIEIFETASFYTMFNRVPVGKYHLQLCGTTPCQLCGSREV
jgi:NADH dehydrogenase (ubiquinone) flavoprotein 2